MKKLFIVLLFVFSVGVIVSTAAEAKTLTVSITNTPPFVVIPDNGENITGFSIGILKGIVNNLSIPVRIKYEIAPDFLTHLKDVETGKVDLGISATVLTSNREKVFDFSHSFYHSSLGILILQKESTLAVIKSILTSDKTLKFLLFLLIYIFLCAHIIWLIELRSSIFKYKYVEGILYGFWWTIVTISTVGYGDISPKKLLGKIFAVMVIISGVCLFSFTLSAVVSNVTIKHIENSINGPQDLINKPVAAIRGTISKLVAEKAGMRVYTVDTLKEGLNALKEGKVNAYIDDDPILEYYLNNHTNSPYKIAVQNFHRIDYGITFPRFSKLRKEFNIGLIRFMEGNDYDPLVNKWF